MSTNLLSPGKLRRKAQELQAAFISPSAVIDRRLPYDGICPKEDDKSLAATDVLSSVQALDHQLAHTHLTADILINFTTIYDGVDDVARLQELPQPVLQEVEQ